MPTLAEESVQPAQVAVDLRRTRAGKANVGRLKRREELLMRAASFCESAVTGAAVTAVLLVAWLMSVILLSLLTVCCRRNRGLHRENESFCLQIEKLRCQMQKQEDELISQQKQLARQHVDEMTHLATRCITTVHRVPSIVMSFKLAFGCIKRYITAIGKSATTVIGAVSTVTKCCSDAARCIHRPIDAIINSASYATSITMTRSAMANPTATIRSIIPATAATTPTTHITIVTSQPEVTSCDVTRASTKHAARTTSTGETRRMARSGEMSVSYVNMFYGWFGARGDDALNPCASCSCELPRSTNPAVTGVAVTAVLLVAWLMSVILLSLLTVCCRRNRGLHRENEYFCLRIEKLRCQLQKQEDELITQRKQLARQHVDEMKHLATRCITAVHGAPNIVTSFKLAFGCIKRYITAVGTSATTVTGAISTITKAPSRLSTCSDPRALEFCSENARGMSIPPHTSMAPHMGRERVVFDESGQVPVESNPQPSHVIPSSGATGVKSSQPPVTADSGVGGSPAVQCIPPPQAPSAPDGPAFGTRSKSRRFS
ncbi:unnamed protein product [Lampetra planeri]